MGHVTTGLLLETDAGVHHNIEHLVETPSSGAAERPPVGGGADLHQYDFAERLEVVRVKARSSRRPAAPMHNRGRMSVRTK